MKTYTATVQRLREFPLLQPLARRDFRLFWIGQSVSLLGDQFHFVALPWLTLQITGSGVALGTVLSVAAIPRAIFMLIGGVLSDRLAPRMIIFVSMALRAVLISILAALVFSGVIQLWHVYVIALAFGVIDALFYPASLSIVPLLVDEEQLEASNSLVRGTQQLSVLVGPAPAGVLVAAAGLATVFGTAALTFAFGAVMVWLMQGTYQRGTDEDASDAGSVRGVLSDIGAGVRYAWNDPVLRAILVFIALVDFSATAAFGVGVPSLADSRFMGEATAFGIMLSAWGGGTLLGTVVAGAIGPIRRRGRLLIALAVAFSAGLSAVGFAPSLIVASAIIAGMGVVTGFVNVAFVSWLQKRTDPAMLGRVMSLVVFASVGLSPIAYAVAGVMVDWNLTLTFVAAGALVLLAGVYSTANRVVRTID